MKWQQITMIVYLGLVLAVGMITDGKPKTGKYSFVDSFIAVCFWFIVLCTGGFWNQ
jgi:hypothetical protein